MVAALAYIQRLVDMAEERRWTYSGASEVQRLTRAGVTAMDMLKTAAAFYAFAMQHPQLFPDQAAFDFALSRAVFGLAPRPRRVVASGKGVGTSYSPPAKVSALRSFGRFLRQQLAGFFASVLRSLEEREAAKARAVEALRQPLEQPIGAFVEGAPAVQTPSNTTNQGNQQ